MWFYFKNKNLIISGPPGSGKSYLAKLIRDREAEYNGAVRIMSIDDYFMQEGVIEEKDPITGKTVCFFILLPLFSYSVILSYRWIL